MPCCRSVQYVSSMLQDKELNTIAGLVPCVFWSEWHLLSKELSEYDATIQMREFRLPLRPWEWGKILLSHVCRLKGHHGNSLPMRASRVSGRDIEAVIRYL